MWNLDYNKYAAVWCKRTPIAPWIIKSCAMQKLASNSAYIENLTDSQNPLGIDDTLFVINQLKLHSFAPPSQAPNILNNLGLVSLGIPSGPFSDRKQYSTFFQQADVLLATEKFSAPGGNYPGSSRHVLLKDIQLKGIGRNSLVTDFEYSHSCGTLTAFDAFKGLVSGMVVNNRTKLPELECLGIFTYLNHSTDGLPNCLLARSADSYRLAHCWPGLMNESEKLIIQKHLSSRFPGATHEEMMRVIMENYIHAFSVGVLHRSPSLDNLLVDGRWIDSESLDFTFEKSCYPTFIQFFVPDGAEKSSYRKDDTLAGLLGSGREVQFYGSWIHQLRYACLAHDNFFRDFNKSYIFNFSEEFKKIIIKYLPHDADFWLEHCLKYPSRPEIQSLYSNRNGLLTYQEEFSSILNDFSLHGHFYDTLLKGWILYFSPKEDPHAKCMNMINKIFRMFPPVPAEWEKSHGHYDSLKNSLRKIFE